MIRFNPDDAKGVVLPIGKYPAVIEGLAPGTSKKSGLPYLKAQVRVFGADREVVVFDVLMLEGEGLFRLKNLATACGMKAEFDSGELDEEKLLQQNVIAELGIEEDEQYGDRNRIKRYEPKAPVAAGSAPAQRSKRAMQNAKPGEFDGMIPDAEVPF